MKRNCYIRCQSHSLLLSHQLQRQYRRVCGPSANPPDKARARQDWHMRHLCLRKEIAITYPFQVSKRQL